jgi:hypothetical protein
LFHCGYSLDDLLEMAKFFKALPDYYIENVNGKDIRLIHAYCKKNLNETTHDDFIWGRDFAETDEFCEGETVIYGHTPTIFDGKDGNIEICINEQINAVKVNIDCGCVYGNKLCILRLDDMRYWYQKVIDDE